jgi:Fe2+ or Zn2+ uptake regulation protein
MFKIHKDIMKENNDISYTSAYRKIKWLLDEGLIVVDKIVFRFDRKKINLYHSTIKAFNVRCEDIDVFVQLSLSKILTLQRSG